jgi:protein pelota
VQNESSTGSTTASRVRTTLTITVEKTDFDVQAGALHVSGPVSEENKYVKMGQYHTLDLEMQRNVTIIKDEWDSVALDRVKDACDVSKKAEVGAIVLQEGNLLVQRERCVMIGLANLCLLTEHMTILRQRIEMNIPRKDKGSSSNHDKVSL